MNKEENRRLTALRLIAIIGAAILLVVGLSACGTTATEAPTEEATEPPAARI